MSRSEYVAIAEVFRLLSEFYKYPNQEFYEYISTEMLQSELKEWIGRSDFQYDIQIVNPFADFDEMRKEYTRTFIGINSTPAMPVESVYKVWTTDESAAVGFAKSKGYLMGDSALHVQYLLEQFQLDIPSELGKKPDHISVLLELLAYLLDNHSDHQVLTFINDHFDWLADFKQKLQEVDSHELYIYITELLIDLIKELKRYLLHKTTEKVI